MGTLVAARAAHFDGVEKGLNAACEGRSRHAPEASGAGRQKAAAALSTPAPIPPRRELRMTPPLAPPAMEFTPAPQAHVNLAQDLERGRRAKRARVESRNLDFSPAVSSVAGEDGGMSSCGAAGHAAPGEAQCEAEVVEVHCSDDFWRVQVEAIYRRRNPYKLHGVGALLAQYKGNEALLYRKVCRAYDLKEDRFYTDESAWVDGEGATDLVATQAEGATSFVGQLASLLRALRPGCRGRARAQLPPIPVAVPAQRVARPSGAAHGARGYCARHGWFDDPLADGAVDGVEAKVMDKAAEVRSALGGARADLVAVQEQLRAGRRA